MRLLTHNTMRNNAADAKGKGFPLKITATQVSVDEPVGSLDERQLYFVRNVLGTLDWPALVQVGGMTMIVEEEVVCAEARSQHERRRLPMWVSRLYPRC